MKTLSNEAASNILECTALGSISATLLAAAITHSPAVTLTVSALASLSIAGVAWYLDKQNVSLAKNPAAHFTKKKSVSGLQAEDKCVVFTIKA